MGKGQGGRRRWREAKIFLNIPLVILHAEEGM
jgi:hypothetical protein